ncbi:hypothetical protein C8Q70DRAFT_1057057 [Cubamyces menziesii]|nr:hypothetical protein C8Q70DRAFT_1057057 [Cubamyces menziesii]
MSDDAIVTTPSTIVHHAHDQLHLSPETYRSHIMRVPPELLILIFRELQGLFKWPKASPYQARLWLRATWVCRRWREIFLSTPTFWSSISSINSACKPVERAWVVAALTRAAGVPLDIDVMISDHGERAPSFLASLLVHAHNIRVLRLQMTTYSPCRGSMQPFFELMVPHRLSMPILEVLDLEDMVWSFSGFNRSYLSHLTREHVPRLHELSLAYVHFPWNSELYSSLSCLSLDHIPSPPTIEEFLQILRACPALRKLRVSDALPENDLAEQPLPRDRSIIALPCLRYMYIDGEYTVVAYICDLLEVPRSCEVGVEYYHAIETNQPLRLISAVLPRQRAFRGAVLQSTMVTLQSENTEGYGKSFAYLQLGPDEGQSWFIRIESECAADADMDITSWQELLHTFRNAPLTSISIMPVDLITLDMWSALFHQFPSLDTIEVGPERGYLFKENRKEYMQHSIHPLLQALHSFRRDSEEICVPNLRALALNILVVDTDIAESILSLIRKRNTMGAPMERLEFRDCVCQADIGREQFVSQLKRAGVADVVT